MSLPLIESIRQARPDERVASYTETVRRFHDVQSSGDPVVVATGGHIIYHRGHVLWFQTVRRFAGNQLVAVGAENDASLFSNRGVAPVRDESDRVTVLADSKSVDWAFVLPDVPTYADPESFIDRYRDFGRVILVAPEWDPFNEQRRIQAERTNVIFVPLRVPRLDISATKIARKIQRSSHRY